MQSPRPKALLSWSSGKDSAWALHLAQQAGDIEIVGLFTTVNESADRVAMHGVRRDILKAQAAATGLPLYTAELPWPCSNKDYERIMSERLTELVPALGVSQFVFGDLYLQDIRDYRESQLARAGLKAVFPLWGIPTQSLARQMISGGLEARLACVDSAQCPPEVAGQAFDEALLCKLPKAVDPCGENGEFHTVVSNGPMFSRELKLEKREQHVDGPFIFTDFSIRGTS